MKKTTLRYISKHLTKLLWALFLMLSVSASRAQEFWKTTNEFPGGPKTGITISNDSCLFAGLVNGVIKSINDGQNFETVLTAPAIFTIFSSKKGDVFAAGAGKIYRTTDLGESWDTISLPTFYPITQLIENNDGDFFAITGVLDIDLGYLGDGVLFSEDNGTTWEKRNAGLGKYTSCERISIDQYGTLYLAVADEYVTGNAGLFVSDNNGLQWEHINITIDGKCVVPDKIKIGNTMGLSVSNEDSIYFSFTGTAVNALVRLNTSKSIHDIKKDNFWNVFKIFESVSWWLDRPINNIHFAQNGNRYSSSRGSTNTGATYYLEKDSTIWKKTDSGLGINIYGLRYFQYFAEKADGSIFMIHLLDEKIYKLSAKGQPTTVPDNEINEHRIYPNPVNAGESIFISHTNGLGNYTVSIIDINGRIIQTTNSRRNKLSMEAPHNPGLYLIQIEKQPVKLVSKLLVR